MHVTIGADGGKNCHLILSGFVEEESSAPVPVVFFSTLLGSPRKLRIDSITFAIQEKMGFNLFWIINDGASYELIMPIESRGYFAFDKIESLSSPPGACGLALEAFNVKQTSSAFIMFDLTKQ